MYILSLHLFTYTSLQGFGYTNVKFCKENLKIRNHAGIKNFIKLEEV